MPKINNFGKLKINKLYFLPDGEVVRVVRINATNDNIIVYNYHSHTNQSLNLRDADRILIQAYKLADAAKYVGKKSATLRKYESVGLLPKAKKISTNPDGRAQTRVYSLEDLDELRRFFTSRRPVGRPRSKKIDHVNKNDIKQRIDILKAKEI